jgi:hypothetical protein
LRLPIEYRIESLTSESRAGLERVYPAHLPSHSFFCKATLSLLIASVWICVTRPRIQISVLVRPRLDGGFTRCRLKFASPNTHAFGFVAVTRPWIRSRSRGILQVWPCYLLPQRRPCRLVRHLCRKPAHRAMERVNSCLEHAGRLKKP